MEPLARTERAALCNTALDLGADSPTLCEGWTVKDLVIHLLIRERNPVAASAIVFSPLEPLAQRSAKRLGEQDFTTLVERVRGGPPTWSPMALPPLDRALNGLEYFVHHEDLRRAQDQWQPRELTDDEQRQIWTMVGYAGRGLVRPAGVPVELRWPGASRDGGDRTKTLRSGEGAAVVSGQPAEVAMFLFGRSRHRGLTYDGPPDAVRALQGGRLEL